MRRLFRFLTSRGLWVVVGLIVLSSLVWWVGPLVSIANWRPLDGVTTRVVVIALIFLLWLLFVLVRWWRAKDINARLLNQLARAQTVAGVGEKAGTEEVAELRKRFETALEVLKKTRRQRGESGWLAAARRQHVYQLPWYVFIGPPGSGKTTALINSGLHFPLADQFGKAAIRGVGGTRNCDWWFTDEAVLLDTAGRYSTQESNEALDRAEWDGFLALLRRFRPRQPINGVLLTVSVADLLGLSEEERAAQSSAMRKRLQELRDGLSIDFPVYVVVTKADLLGGFNEYHASLGKEERAQVWGFTFRYDPTGRPPADFTASFREEFRLLLDRANAGVPELLLAERDPMRRALCYALPQQLAGLQDVLEQFLAPLFAGSRYAEAPLVRGVYFTSGTQEGTPFDRVLSAIGRQFGGESRVVRSGPLGEGKSYFLHDLLARVIIGEAHLAGRNLVWERRRALLRTGGYIAIGVAFAALLGGWLVSWSNNKAYLAEVAARTETFSGKLQGSVARLDDSLAPLLPLLEEARGLSAPTAFPVDQPVLSHRFGLYQGYKIDAAVTQAYRRLLDDGLLPRIAMRLETVLREAPPDNLELQYEALKGYLMLHHPEHFDASSLKAWILADWKRNLAHDVPNEVREQLGAHLDVLFADRAVSSPFPMDEPLVAAARKSLVRYTVAQRTYGRLKRQLERMDLPEFNVASVAGPQAPLVFARASGLPLTRGVPGVFSVRGFHDGFNREVNGLATLLGGEEAWVLREDGPQGVREQAAGLRQKLDEIGSRRLVNEVKRLYFEDYIRTWDAFLADITLVPMRSLQDSIQTARVLSSADSPLAMLVRAAARETTLARPDARADTRSSLLQKGKDTLRETREDLERVFGPANVPGGGTVVEAQEQMVDRRFEALRRLAGSPQGQGQAPIDSTLQLINEVYTVFTATEAALQRGMSPPPGDAIVRARAEAARLPQPVRGMLEALVGSGSAQAAGLTRQAMAGTASALVGDFCRRALGGRYPVDRNSPKDVLPDDFTRLFAPGGLFDDYFQKNLAAVVDVTTTPWTLKAGAGAAPPGTAGWLASFQRAAVVRDVFFRAGSRSPSVRVEIRPLELDAAFAQMTLDVDGQVLTHVRGAPPTPLAVNWPGPKGTGQVRLTVDPAPPPAAGASATPAGAPSAGGGPPTARPQSIVTEGAWALHRLFDRMKTSPGSSPERFVATASFDGRPVVLEVTAGSVQNPFRLPQLREFRCPASN